MNKILQIARDKNGKLNLYNGNIYREKNEWQYDQCEYLEIDENLFPELKWEDEPVVIYIARTDIFESMDDIDKFANDHVTQKTEKELSFLNNLNPSELYHQGLIEGMLNGLLATGYDVENLENLDPMEEK